MYDLIIKNGSIVDGSGGKAFIGDVAVKDGVIAQVAPGIVSEAAQTVDATGQVVAPGFIDIHRHCDAAVFRPGYGELELRQGITSSISGNCGLSIAPCPAKWRKEILQYLRPAMGSLPDGIEFESFSEYFAALKKTKLPLNYGMLVGNGTLLMASRGFGTHALEEKDYKEIHRYLRDAVDAGAFGVSVGLVYVPEAIHDVNSLEKALDPIRNTDIPMITHVRGEGDLLVKSLEEVITVARRLRAPLHVSHFKCVGRRNWGHLLAKAIGLIEEAQADGVRITCDVYPWTAGSTLMVQLLPPSYSLDGLEQTVKYLKDPAKRKECREILEVPQSSFENLLYLVGWENIMVSAVQTPANKKYEGMRVTEIAQEKGMDPYECAFDLLVEENCNVSMVNFIACDEDIDTILQLPYCSIVSDAIYPDSGKPHPRQHGTFPKVLAEYVRERKVLSLEQAIHKFTGRPALDFHIPQKGFLKAGYDADIAIFNPDTVQTLANYVDSTVLGTGFSHVFVNGVLANSQDSFINSGAGKLLRRG